MGSKSYGRIWTSCATNCSWISRPWKTPCATSRTNPRHTSEKNRRLWNRLRCHTMPRGSSCCDTSCYRTKRRRSGKSHQPHKKSCRKRSSRTSCFRCSHRSRCRTSCCRTNSRASSHTIRCSVTIGLIGWRLHCGRNELGRYRNGSCLNRSCRAYGLLKSEGVHALGKLAITLPTSFCAWSKGTLHHDIPARSARLADMRRRATKSQARI